MSLRNDNDLNLPTNNNTPTISSIIALVRREFPTYTLCACCLPLALHSARTRNIGDIAFRLYALGVTPCRPGLPGLRIFGDSFFCPAIDSPYQILAHPNPTCAIAPTPPTYWHSLFGFLFLISRLVHPLSDIETQTPRTQAHNTRLPRCQFEFPSLGALCQKDCEPS